MVKCRIASKLRAARGAARFSVEAMAILQRYSIRRQGIENEQLNFTRGLQCPSDDRKLC